MKHKVFISFYHYDDECYKIYLEKKISNYCINKSVKAGEYDPDNKDTYIKRLIREDKISDSSIVIVLVGPNTKNRKHVDWEIYAALSKSINGASALIGVLLPEFPLLEGNKYDGDDLPPRLYDNVKTGYSNLYKWDFFIKDPIAIINKEFESKNKKNNLINNSRIQMIRNK